VKTCLSEGPETKARKVTLLSQVKRQPLQSVHWKVEFNGGKKERVSAPESFPETGKGASPDPDHNQRASSNVNPLMIVRRALRPGRNFRRGEISCERSSGHPEGFAVTSISQRKWADFSGESLGKGPVVITVA